MCGKYRNSSICPDRFPPLFESTLVVRMFCFNLGRNQACLLWTILRINLKTHQCITSYAPQDTSSYNNNHHFNNPDWGIPSTIIHLEIHATNLNELLRTHGHKTRIFGTKPNLRTHENSTAMPPVPESENDSMHMNCSRADVQWCGSSLQQSKRQL